MNLNFRVLRFSFAMLLLAIWAGCASNLSTRNQRILHVDRQISPANRELIGRLYRHYREISDKDQAAIQRRVAETCRLDEATEADSLFDGQKIRFTGDYSEGAARGPVCVWDLDGHLLKFGIYDDQGRVSDLAVEWTNEQPRIIEEFLPEEQVRVRRSFYLLTTPKKLYRVLVRLELRKSDGSRNVRYMFDHLTSALLRRSETRIDAQGQKRVRGIQFILSTNKLVPICTDHLDDGKQKRLAPRDCKLPIADDIIAGADRI